MFNFNFVNENVLSMRLNVIKIIKKYITRPLSDIARNIYELLGTHTNANGNCLRNSGFQLRQASQNVKTTGDHAGVISAWNSRRLTGMYFR